MAAHCGRDRCARTCPARSAQPCGPQAPQTPRPAATGPRSGPLGRPGGRVCRVRVARRVDPGCAGWRYTDAVSTMHRCLRRPRGPPATRAREVHLGEAAPAFAANGGRASTRPLLFATRHTIAPGTAAMLATAGRQACIGSQRPQAFSSRVPARVRQPLIASRPAAQQQLAVVCQAAGAGGLLGQQAPRPHSARSMAAKDGGACTDIGSIGCAILRAP
jgi:hypothetical protein